MSVEHEEPAKARICPFCRKTRLEPDETYCQLCEDALEAEREELRCSDELSEEKP